MREKFHNLILVISLILCGILVYMTINTYKLNEEIKQIKTETIQVSQNAVDLYKIAEIFNLYEKEYINEIEEDQTIYMDIMLKALSASMKDKYGGYITAQEAVSVEKELSGTYTGVGIIVLYPENEEYIVVDEVFPNTPADGILNVGDKIYKINGFGAQTEEGVIELQNISTSGAKEVTLTVNGEDVVIPLDVVNLDVVKIDIEGETAFIKISSFTENSGNEFIKEFNRLINNNKISNLVFDLRNNAGGDKLAVTQIIDRLAPKGEIYTEKYKNYENVVTSDDECVDIPIYILGNEYSASASELFIMALQDTNNATFIGRQTYGKSTILGYYPLTDGSSLLMSVGYYYPPSNRFIEGVGIIPDIEENEDPMARVLDIINSNN